MPLQEVNHEQVQNQEKDIQKSVRTIIDQLDMMDRTYFAKDR